jgi:hypothetical protein
VAQGNGDAYGQAAVGLLRVILSLNFPLMLMMVGLTSTVLEQKLNLPQFGWWADMDRSLEANRWGSIGAGVFFLASFPLAWLAFREHATRASNVVGAWVGAAVATGITVFAAVSWPNNSTEFQKWIFAFLLFVAVGSVYEAIFDSLKLRSQMHANRPLPPPTHQQPHGSRDEPDTI